MEDSQERMAYIQYSLVSVSRRSYFFLPTLMVFVDGFKSCAQIQPYFVHRLLETFMSCGNANLANVKQKKNLKKIVHRPTDPIFVRLN